MVTPGRVARIAGTSVRGVSHARDGLPNQDALALVQGGANDHGRIVAAVADGHGSARHFRSAVGSRFAVDAAISALRRFAEDWEAAEPERQSQIATSDLPQAIVTEWLEQVRRDLDATPITDTEWQAVESASGADVRAQVQAEPRLAYGATLIAALVTSKQVLLLQVGDGDALLVASDGKAWHPIPKDERLTGEFTTSICRADAAADFRHSITPVDSKLSLLVLATDGYSNSFRTEADFLQVGTDVLELIRKHGVTQVERQLPQILEHASTNGSGDDITMAIVYLEEADRFVKAGASAARSTMRVSEVRAELATLKRQVQQSKKVVAAVALIALATLAWTFRGEILAFTKPVPPRGEATPPITVKPGEVSDGGPASKDATAKVSITARRAPPLIKIGAKITFSGVTHGACTAEETLSAPGFPNLGKASQPLTLPVAATQPIELADIGIAVPKDTKQRKALQDADAKATIEVTCDGKSLAHATTRIGA
jgi:serine/threonine protein phosphatase PrpC